MPNATVGTTAERYELHCLPAKDGEEGGFIMARPLPYGKKLERRDKATRMSMEQEVRPQGTRRRPKTRSVSDEPEIQKIELETMNAWSFMHDCAYCIVDHNLTDTNGTKLDFNNPLVYGYLDPKVGAEIEEILAELNGDMDDADVEDFTKPAITSVPESATT